MNLHSTTGQHLCLMSAISWKQFLSFVKSDSILYVFDQWCASLSESKGYKHTVCGATAVPVLKAVVFHQSWWHSMANCNPLWPHHLVLYSVYFHWAPDSLWQKQIQQRPLISLMSFRILRLWHRINFCVASSKVYSNWSCYLRLIVD